MNPKRKKYSKKQILKLYRKTCFFCGENNYNLLDVHRIIEGGKYYPMNSIVACCRCHRLIHQDKSILIDRKYLSTKGIVVHFWKDKIEYWKCE